MIRSIACNTCKKPIRSSEEWLIHIHQSISKEGLEEKHNLMCLRCGEAFQSFKLLRCHISKTGHVTPDSEATASTSSARERSIYGGNGEEAIGVNADRIEGDDKEQMYSDSVRWGAGGFQGQSIFGPMEAVPGPQDGTFLNRLLEMEYKHQRLLVADLDAGAENQQSPAKCLNAGAKGFNFDGELASK